MQKKDLLLLSTLCQDAIFTKDELYFDKINRIFVTTFSRFCWEYQDKVADKTIFYRVISGIRILNVRDIIYENLDKIENKFLSLLSIECEKKVIIFYFSSNINIKIFVSKMKIYLDDLDIPWPTAKKPKHK